MKPLYEPLEKDLLNLLRAVVTVYICSLRLNGLLKKNQTYPINRSDTSKLFPPAQGTKTGSLTANISQLSGLTPRRIDTLFDTSLKADSRHEKVIKESITDDFHNLLHYLIEICNTPDKHHLFQEVADEFTQELKNSAYTPTLLNLVIIEDTIITLRNALYSNYINKTVNKLFKEPPLKLVNELIPHKANRRNKALYTRTFYELFFYYGISIELIKQKESKFIESHSNFLSPNPHGLSQAFVKHYKNFTNQATSKGIVQPSINLASQFTFEPKIDFDKLLNEAWLLLSVKRNSIKKSENEDISTFKSSLCH